MKKYKDSFNDRMKHNYENRAKTYLTRRMPVIIRLDGKAFHTFTRGLKKPYDEVFHKTMNMTMQYLCQNIQGCKFGYTQSDEITLLLTDYDTLTTAAWFDYSVQKLCSVSASMATMAFNKAFAKNSQDILRKINNCFTCTSEEEKYASALEKCIDKGAMFDARCFNIPKEEVVNCFIWRQEDAIRNAIQMLGQAHFSNKQLQGKSREDIKSMLISLKNIYFDCMPLEFQRGVCCYKTLQEHQRIDMKTDERTAYMRGVWKLDTAVPVFHLERDYIERFVTGYEH